MSPPGPGTCRQRLAELVCLSCVVMTLPTMALNGSDRSLPTRPCTPPSAAPRAPDSRVGAAAVSAARHVSPTAACGCSKRGVATPAPPLQTVPRTHARAAYPGSHRHDGRHFARCCRPAGQPRYGNRPGTFAVRRLMLKQHVQQEPLRLAARRAGARLAGAGLPLRLEQQVGRWPPASTCEAQCRPGVPQHSGSGQAGRLGRVTIRDRRRAVRRRGHRSYVVFKYRPNAHTAGVTTANRAYLPESLLDDPLSSGPGPISWTSVSAFRGVSGAAGTPTSWRDDERRGDAALRSGQIDSGDRSRMRSAPGVAAAPTSSGGASWVALPRATLRTQADKERLRGCWDWMSQRTRRCLDSLSGTSPGCRSWVPVRCRSSSCWATFGVGSSRVVRGAVRRQGASRPTGSGLTLRRLPNVMPPIIIIFSGR